jgi:hypothetical protein
MSNTTKNLSERDYQQTLRHSYNDINGTIGVDGFVVGKVGRKIVRSIISTTTDDFEFYESATLLYTIRIIYTNAAHDDLVSVERTV